MAGSVARDAVVDRAFWRRGPKMALTCLLLSLGACGADSDKFEAVRPQAGATLGPSAQAFAPSAPDCPALPAADAQPQEEMLRAIAPEQPLSPPHTPKAAPQLPTGPARPRHRHRALDAAVTLDITGDADLSGGAPSAHVRCDGIRVAPHVVLTAAHCFAWHRAPDDEMPPRARVVVRGPAPRGPTGTGADADAVPSEAMLVVLHPRYPALSCSQPSRTSAAACLQAVGRCWAVHGRDTPRRSACLHSVAEQVIERHNHGSYDLALVFVASDPWAPQPGDPSEGVVEQSDDEGEDAYTSPYATLVRETFAAPMGPSPAFWQSAVDASSDAWRTTLGGPVHTLTQGTGVTDLTCDADAQQTPSRRLFDGAFVRSPQDGATPWLVAWASRSLHEHPIVGALPPVRYTRLVPHLLWMVDTIARVRLAYPNVAVEMPTIVDVDVDVDVEACRRSAFASPDEMR